MEKVQYVSFLLVSDLSFANEDDEQQVPEKQVVPSHASSKRSSSTTTTTPRPGPPGEWNSSFPVPILPQPERCLKTTHNCSDRFRDDDFNDVLEALVMVSEEQEQWRRILDQREINNRRRRGRITLAHLVDEVGKREICLNNTWLGSCNLVFLSQELSENATVYERFQLGLSDLDLYPENDPNVESVLRGLSDSRFAKIEQKEGGTQFKLIVDLEDGGVALYKPMRFPREQVRVDRNCVKVRHLV